MSFFSDNQEALSHACWTALGEGSYNQVMVSIAPITLTFNGQSYTTRWVYKEPKLHKFYDDSKKSYYDVDPLSMPERAVRIWNDFHPQTPAVAAGLGLGRGNGWFAPYLGKVLPNDEQTAEGILEYYRAHRRIISDGCGEGNFVLYHGKARCIDVDYALGRHSPLSLKTIEEELYQEENPEEYSKNHHDYWASNQAYMPLSVRTIVTLLYLEKSIAPKDIDNRHLTLSMIEKLREARYRAEPASIALLERLNPRPSLPKTPLLPLQVESTTKEQHLSAKECLQHPQAKKRKRPSNALPEQKPTRLTRNATLPQPMQKGLSSKGQESVRLARDLSIIRRAANPNALSALERRRLQRLKEAGSINQHNQLNITNAYAHKLKAFELLEETNLKALGSLQRPHKSDFFQAKPQSLRTWAEKLPRHENQLQRAGF